MPPPGGSTFGSPPGTMSCKNGFWWFLLKKICFFKNAVLHKYYGLQECVLVEPSNCIVSQKLKKTWIPLNFPSPKPEKNLRKTWIPPNLRPLKTWEKLGFRWVTFPLNLKKKPEKTNHLDTKFAFILFERWKNKLYSL